MSRSTATATRPQLALQSYLDGLLQDAAVELEQELADSGLDDFEAAVLEEQIRDAQVAPRAEAPPLALVQPVEEVIVAPVAEAPPAVVVAPIAMPPLVEPLADVHRPIPQLAAVLADGRPDWAEEPFECLLFDVAGLTLAVPLVCRKLLTSIFFVGIGRLVITSIFVGST